MKNTRKLLCALLAAALLILSIVPAVAELSVDPSAESIYLRSKDGSTSQTDWIYISGVEKEVKITGCKSSKKAVASIGSIENGHWHYNYLDEDRTNDSYSAEVGVNLNKPGKATISFKVDGKAFKKQYTILAYTNPLKSFQLTGIGSKNLKSVFATKASVNDQMTKDAKAGTMKVTAASGWKVKEISWRDSTKDLSRRYSYGSKGVASAQMPILAMKKGNSYSMSIEMVNTKTQGTLSLYYYFY